MKRLTKYSNNPFVRNLGAMFSGNGLALVIPFMMAPLISRIYSPVDFAGFELFVQIIGLVGIIGSLRLEYAILLPKKFEESKALTQYCFKLLFRISLGIGVLIVLLREEIAGLLKNEDLANLLWISPLAIFSLGSVNILNQFLFRIQHFKQVGLHKVTSATANHGSKYLFGVVSPSSLGLSLGQVFGYLAPVLAYISIGKIRRELISKSKNSFSGSYFLKKYRDFTRINSAHAFFDEGQKALLLFIISNYYGEMVLGLFGFAFRYIRIPLQVFGSSLAQVLNERWARNLNEDGFSVSEVIRTCSYIGLIAVVPFTLLFFFGAPIFTFIFGDDWTTAGGYAEILAPWLFLNFVVSPLSSLPILLNRQGQAFAIAVTGNVLTLVLVFIAAYFDYNFTTLLWLMVLSNSALMIFSLVWFIHISKKGREKQSENGFE